MQTYNMSREDFVDLKSELITAIDERHRIYIEEIDAKNAAHIKILDKKHKIERTNYSKKIVLAVTTCAVIILGSMGYAVDKSVQAIESVARTEESVSRIEQKSDLTVQVMEAEDQSIWKAVNSSKADVDQMKQWLLDNSSIRYRGTNPRETVNTVVKK